MLHAAKLILSGNGLTGEQLHASPLGRLSRTCAEAARRQLKVVATLRKRNMIGKLTLDFWYCFTNTA